ncbi:glutathione s-transferase [Moniliophthora roreri MCA 2997]|uniref:Glutathione s-transferase n=2 Tax=Moniliophthora roreri TaxID=221103 RepID=V2WZD7_MONRO|nr:glutathione s-transferase [Moniliophthora roreri MCA 2997]KAI3615820.1 glutathione s-transferase [Moniliophthora roreri]
MAAQPTVILYRYDISPFCWKADNILLLKGIPHKRVNVSLLLPRPEITDDLGLNYRRVPIMTIGNDIYCDTSLMIPVLERRFPNSKSIFPPRKGGGAPDTGLIRAFSKYFVDDAVLPAAVTLAPWEGADARVIEDRTRFLGGNVNLVQHMLAKRGKGVADLDAHLALVEEQVADGREWLFDTEGPSLADVAIHWVCEYFKDYDASLLDDKKFPCTLKWFERMSEHLETKRRGHQLWKGIDSETAGKEAAAGQFEPYDVRGFDERVAKWLGVERGQTVSIAPAGDGLPYNAKDYSTIGKLVSLNTEEICVEIEGKLGTFRCHFPRLGYTVKPL